MNNLEPEKNNEQKDENLLDEKKQQNNEENENNDKAVEKLPCEVVEDLLPLYEEKLVGEATAKLIENHAQTSPSCRKKLFAHKAQEELPCETIGDLLSLYSEGLTGEVTTKLIEKHLKTCPKCAKKLSFLQNKQNEDKEKALEAYIGENPIDRKLFCFFRPGNFQHDKVHIWSVYGRCIFYCLYIYFYLRCFSFWPSPFKAVP